MASSNALLTVWVWCRKVLSGRKAAAALVPEVSPCSDLRGPAPSICTAEVNIYVQSQAKGVLGLSVLFLDLSHSFLISAEGLVISVWGKYPVETHTANPDVTAACKEQQIGQESFRGNMWFHSVQTLQACTDDQDKAIYVNNHQDTERGNTHGEAGN